LVRIGSQDWVMTFAIEFDFSNKRERTVSLEEISVRPPEEAYFWVDLESEPGSEVIEILTRIGVDQLTIDLLMDEDGPPRFNVFQSCLQFTLNEARVVGGQFTTVAV
jgi:magnesium transporter